MKRKNHLQQYLKGYAETCATEIAALLAEQNNHYRHCLVIPAYKESPGFLAQFSQDQLAQQGRLLLIVVINQPQTVLADNSNQALWQHIRQTGPTLAASDHYQLVSAHRQLHILALNHFSHHYRLPPKQGVGLARKIGCDLACALIQQQQLDSLWIHTTDADSQLPTDYFMQTAKYSTASAAVYAYQHRSNSNIQLSQATQVYQRALHYYVDGLRYADSPYAYHTLGSCIAINARSYAQARGFPKKAGGEDFYLLNKLAKLGNIVSLEGKPVLIEARRSHRVPFGTGPAVDKMIALQQQQQPCRYYHHQSFVELRQVLLNFHQLSQYPQSPCQWLTTQSEVIQSALSDISIHTLFKHLASQQAPQQPVLPQQWMRHIHQWFDAFKTLKFIHALEKHHPRQALDAEIEKLNGLKGEENQKAD